MDFAPETEELWFTAGRHTVLKDKYTYFVTSKRKVCNPGKSKNSGDNKIFQVSKLFSKEKKKIVPSFYRAPDFKKIK